MKIGRLVPSYRLVSRVARDGGVMSARLVLHGAAAARLLVSRDRRRFSDFSRSLVGPRSRALGTREHNIGLQAYCCVYICTRDARTTANRPNDRLRAGHCYVRTGEFL